jgi:O-antigen/teichoic acid export membrane protein
LRIFTNVGVGSFVAPYLAAFLSPTLTSAVVSLIMVRLLVWIASMYAVRHSKILFVNTSIFSMDQLRPLLQLGSWMTVSNIISPLMVYMDRFVVAAVLGVSMTSYYVVPYEVITKLLAIPMAVSSVLFPLFVQQWQSNPASSSNLLRRGFSYTLLILFPPAVMAVFFSKEWLGIWFTPEFATESRLVVTWLTIGVLINSAAQIVFAKVQGAGRSDWTAKLHLAEVIPYIALLYVNLYYFGIAGAAFAWFLRVSIDLLGLLLFSKAINPIHIRTLRPSLWMLLIAVISLILSSLNESLVSRAIEACILMVIYMFILLLQLRSDGMLDKITNILKLNPNKKL